MQAYNAPFFSVYENMYQILNEEFGQNQALLLFKKVMEKGLKKAYDLYGFKKGDPDSFKTVLEARDNAVGLVVEFPEVSANKIIYQFHTDPFVNLNGIVEHELLDHTYINFKVQYLLGNDWSYKTTSHIWDGDLYTEFTIYKN